MGWRFVVQPNGKFARFSEIVDDFTHFDMTRDEALSLYYAENGRSDQHNAEGKVKRAEEHPERFEEDLVIVGEVHGEAIMDERRKELTEILETPVNVEDDKYTKPRVQYRGYYKQEDIWWYTDAEDTVERVKEILSNRSGPWRIEEETITRKIIEGTVA